MSMSKWQTYGHNDRSPARRKMFSDAGIKVRNAKLATIFSAIAGTLLSGNNQKPDAH
jgi:hypothetical protein